jgi:magnesium transporter
MSQAGPTAAAPPPLTVITEALDRDADDEIREFMASVHPAEVADVLESLPISERDNVWELIDDGLRSDVLTELDDGVRTERMQQMLPAELAAIAMYIDEDDAVDILQDLPESRIEAVLEAMDAQERQRLELILAFPEDTAGGLMSLDVITVRGDVTLEVVLRYLRKRGEIPVKTNRLFVVDRDNHYRGEMRLADLLTRDAEELVEDVMDDTVSGITADTPDNEVARLFEQRDLISAAVIDAEGRLLGRITVDDVVDVIRDAGEESLMRMAGLDQEEDIFAPVGVTARRRTIWLGVNLATALFASWVIGLFEATIQYVVALAVLMPVVASMGGIAGSQTLTIVIRGMATGQIGSQNVPWLMRKELWVGLLNSLFWAAVVAGIAALWFDSTGIGLVVGVALVANMLVAALAGTLVPVLLEKMSVDPALAGGVILTTVTDVVGFFTFLGLGTIFLLN